MPLQILQKGPSAMQGALLGLGQGLQELAANKLAAMRQANEQAQFAKTLREANFEPGVANLISALPIEQRLKALSPYLQDPNFMANRGAQAQTAVQPVIPEAVVQEPTIHAAAQQQQFRELAGQKPQQAPQLPSAFAMAQEVRRNALGFPETFTPESVKELIKQFEGFGHQFSPQQRAQIEQQAAEISKSPAQMAALQERYDQAVKNNEMMELRRPGYTGQAVPLQQLQQPGQPLYRQPVKPLTEMEKIAQKTYELKEKKYQDEIYNKIEPYLEGQREDFANATKEYNTAKDMLNIITKHKAKWPTAGGYLPSVLQRDPDVREYDRLANELVIIQTNSLKGQPTNYKTRIVEKGKIDLTQPVETQIGALKKIIAKDKKVFDIQDDINKTLEKNEGKYTRDFAQKITKAIGRPDIGESQQLAPGAKLTDIDTSKLPNGHPINGPDGKKYVWDAAQKKPVLAGFGGK